MCIRARGSNLLPTSHSPVCHVLLPPSDQTRRIMCTSRGELLTPTPTLMTTPQARLSPPTESDGGVGARHCGGGRRRVHELPCTSPNCQLVRAQSVPAVLFRVSGKRRSHTRASTSVWDGTRQGCAVSRLHNYLAPGVPMAASRQRGRHLRYSRTRLVVEHPSLPPRSSLVRRRDAKAVWRQWQWHCAPRKQRTTPRKKDGAADN